VGTNILLLCFHTVLLVLCKEGDDSLRRVANGVFGG